MKVHADSYSLGLSDLTTALSARPIRFHVSSMRPAPTNGGSISLHPQEALVQQLRATMRTPDGRTTLRRRTTVEHSLARLDQIQGKKAR